MNEELALQTKIKNGSNKLHRFDNLSTYAYKKTTAQSKSKSK